MMKNFLLSFLIFAAVTLFTEKNIYSVEPE